MFTENRRSEDILGEKKTKGLCGLIIVFLTEVGFIDDLKSRDLKEF